MKSDKPVKLLIVDDKAENLFALETILSNEHYLCVKASSGNDALKMLLQQQDFSIILMDVQMPEMDGFETAELIRGIELLKHIPIIFLTASMDSTVHIFNGYRAGAVDYMIKPFSPDVLKAKVSVFVDLYQKKHELLIQKEEMERLIRNMTHQKRIENELIEGKNSAEKATQKAEESANLKDAFLSLISHEIRTPLNAIMGFSDVLAKRKLGEQEKEYVGIIKKSGEDLLAIISDIIDMSKLEAGTMIMEKKEMSIRALLTSIDEIWKGKAAKKNLEFVVTCHEDIPAVFSGDPIRLTQTITNLVTNAIKFTEKGTITIHARLHKIDPKTSSIEFSIKDTGIGIPSDKLDPVFDRFRQVESHNDRKQGGIGLGLSITKRLVELQGGTLKVESKLNKGSTFAFSIPFKKAT
jgi:two-component system, sensor histidine kinase